MCILQIKHRSVSDILISTWERSEAIFASSAPCAGVVSNREKLSIRRQSFLSATIAEGKVGLNQSDHLVEASNRMHAYEVPPHKDHRGVDLISEALPFGRPSLHHPGVSIMVFTSGRLSRGLTPSWGTKPARPSEVTKRPARRTNGTAYPFCRRS
jgi:hypothetical protein